MPDPPPERVAQVLDYLDAIGFRELYLRQPEVVVPAAPPARRPVDRINQQPVASAPPDLSGLGLAGAATAAAACTACVLARRRTKVVFGSGAPDADLMFIGEGPGEQEDRQGLPFVGPAGQLLTRIIEAIELRRESVYIANVVKCRPPGNRNPQPDEIAACGGYLERQIALVKPKLIVLLGRVAAQAMLGVEGTLGSMRGRWHEVHGVPARVTYHPAALLRNQQYKRPTWEDMQLVRDRLRDLQSS